MHKVSPTTQNKHIQILLTEVAEVALGKVRNLMSNLNDGMPTMLEYSFALQYVICVKY